MSEISRPRKLIDRSVVATEFIDIIHAAVSRVDMMQTLIELAKEIGAEQARGESGALTPDEIAFDDALADNESAVDIMANGSPKVIAAELVNGLHANASSTGHNGRAPGLGCGR